MTRLYATLRERFRTFVCRDDREHDWLLEMHARFEPRTRLSGAVFAVTLLACMPWLSPLALLLAAGGAAFTVADQLNANTDRPERLVCGWLVSQTLFAVAIVVGGRIGRGDLAILLIPVIGASGGFPDRVVVMCTVYTGLLMVGLAVGLHPGPSLADPPTLLLPLGLLATASILTSAVRHSSIEHRGSALIDPLTGMLNRRALGARTDELEQQSALSSQSVAVLSIDVDHFKTVNDDFGHDLGDAVLAGVAYRIRACLRAYDLAYRLGGEEFLVLLPGASEPQAVAVAEGLVDAIRREEVAGARITVSIGVAASPAGTPFRYDAIYREADKALYRAKAEGRDRVCSFAQTAVTPVGV